MALFPETERHYFYEGITATSNCQGGVQMTLEARKTKRSTHIVEVEYGGEEMQLSARISDLSIGGIFIDTLTPFPIGGTVRLAFVLPGGHRVEAEGVVKHSKETVGMGIQFTRLAQKDSQKIDTFIAGCA